MKDDLLTTLEQLVLHKDRFDYVLIETTGPISASSAFALMFISGVANPGPIISSLWVDDGMDSPLQLDGVVTVVDAVNIMKYLQDAGPNILSMNLFSCSNPSFSSEMFRN